MSQGPRPASPVLRTSLGVYYSFQRWYDPSIGRFIGEDPVSGFLSEPQSANPYSYVVNTPTSLVDATGLVSYLPGGCPGVYADNCADRTPGSGTELNVWGIPVSTDTSHLFFSIGGWAEYTQVGQAFTEESLGGGTHPSSHQFLSREMPRPSPCRSSSSEPQNSPRP